MPGASGQLTARADSGFYAHALVAACREMDVRFSITIRQHKSLRYLIEAIPDADWTPVPYWMDGAADVAQTTYTPFRTEPGAAPVRLIVRRVKPTPAYRAESVGRGSVGGAKGSKRTPWGRRYTTSGRSRAGRPLSGRRRTGAAKRGRSPQAFRASTSSGASGGCA